MNEKRIVVTESNVYFRFMSFIVSLMFCMLPHWRVEKKKWNNFPNVNIDYTNLPSATESFPRLKFQCLNSLAPFRVFFYFIWCQWYFMAVWDGQAGSFALKPRSFLLLRITEANPTHDKDPAQAAACAAPKPLMHITQHQCWLYRCVSDPFNVHKESSQMLPFELCADKKPQTTLHELRHKKRTSAVSEQFWYKCFFLAWTE